MEVRLNIHSTTGGVLVVHCHTEYTVDHLKRTIARRLRLAKDRICLLYRDRQLSEGTLKDNGLVDGAKLILLPSVETGLLTQRPENSVMQALESLNDSQVNDFLSGKTPLNLTMRLGDHMMLIQLQLSTLKAVKTQGSSSSTTSSSSKRARATEDDQVPSTSKSDPVGEETPAKSSPVETDKEPPIASSESASRKRADGDELKTFLRKQDIETLQSAFEIFKSLAEMRDDMDKNTEDSSTANQSENSDNSPSKYSFSSDSSVRDDVSVASESRFEERSPIESLSNLVSSPLKSYERSVSSGKTDETVSVPSGTKYVPLPSSLKNNLVECLMGTESDAELTETNESSTTQTLSDPIAANLTSCLCSTLNPNYSRSSCTDHVSNAHDCDTGSSEFADNPGTLLDDNVTDGSRRFDSPKPKDDRELNKNKRLHYLLHKTSKSSNPISQNKQKIVIHPLINKYLKKKIEKSETVSDENKPSTSKSADCESSSVASNSESETFAFPSSSSSYPVSVDPSPVSDTKALFEASKNLTQTLKKLSKEVLTNKVDLENEESTRSKIGQGAVIESMKHHGKGIYSGTFSGTLNPALQDRFGRPKRDISTIIHILNDLLCATPPQYRSGARMTFEPTHNQSTRLRQRDVKQSNEVCKVDHGESTECSCNKCTVQTKCPYGECNGHYPSPNLDSNNCPCKSSDISNDSALEMCSCSSSRGQSDNHKCNDCSDKKNECKKCCSAKDTLALENSKTKCKLDQLRLVMQQKKQRREARKLKTAPYVNSSSNSSSNIVSSEPPTSVIAEEIDTVA